MNQEHIEALNSMAEEAYQNAVTKGFHSYDETDDMFVTRTCANIHGEVSEFWEAHRDHTLFKPCDKADKMVALSIEPLNCAEEELADIMIRTMDTARRLGLNLGRAVAIKHQYNTTREFRHGGKAA